MTSSSAATPRQPWIDPGRRRGRGGCVEPLAYALSLRWMSGSRMGALGKLFNTTAFKLTLAYLTIFALFAAFLLGYFAWNTRRLITEQITRTVDAEITGLAEQYNQGGIRRLVSVIDARARRPGSSLYLVTTFTGDGLAGNVGSLGEGVLERSGWIETHLSPSRRAGRHRTPRAGARVPASQRFPPAGRARPRGARAALRRDSRSAGQWSIAIVIVLGLTGGFFVARRVLHRIDAMTETAADHHGRRLDRALAGRRFGRRAGSAGGQPQRHARAHRGA